MRVESERLVNCGLDLERPGSRCRVRSVFSKRASHGTPGCLHLLLHRHDAPNPETGGKSPRSILPGYKDGCRRRHERHLGSTAYRASLRFTWRVHLRARRQSWNKTQDIDATRRVANPAGGPELLEPTPGPEHEVRRHWRMVDPRIAVLHSRMEASTPGARDLGCA